MFKSLFAIVLILSSLAVAGPIFVRNGAGKSEYSLVFARLHLAELFSVCGEAKCALSGDATSLLMKLIVRAQTAPDPQFTSGDSGFTDVFKVNPARNVVIFNQDRLWKDQSSSQALDVADSVILWTDVLASLQPGLETAALPELQAALLQALNTKVLRTLVQISSVSSFEALALKKTTGGDLIYVRDAGLNSHDLTPALSSATKCPAQALEKLEIRSMRWNAVPPSSDAGDLRMPLDATATLVCAGQPRRARFRFVVTSFANELGLEIIEPELTRVYGQGE